MQYESGYNSRSNHSTNAVRNAVNTKKVCDCAYAHATNSAAVPTNAAIDARSCADAPVAWKSNGEPPPESWLESCWLGACGCAAVFEAAGGITKLGTPPDIEVGFGSTTRPCDDEVDDSAGRVDVFNVVVVVMVVFEDDSGGGAAGLVVVVFDDVAACVLVCAVVFVLEVEVEVEVVELDVTTLTPHSDLIPAPN
jgi:hypothetical protein